MQNLRLIAVAQRLHLPQWRRCDRLGPHGWWLRDTLGVSHLSELGGPCFRSRPRLEALLPTRPQSRVRAKGRVMIRECRS